MAEHIHWMKTVDKRYLSVGDFDGDKDIIVQIKDVKAGDVTNAQGTQTKQLLYFEGNVKPMVLNTTNMQRIAKVVGSPYFDEWVGHKIQIYPDHHVPAFGTITEGVRVREFAPQA